MNPFSKAEKSKKAPAKKAAAKKAEVPASARNSADPAPEKPKAKVLGASKPKADVKADKIIFESTRHEPSMIECAGITPIRDFSTGRLLWRVDPDDVARFSSHHFVKNGRIRKAPQD